jgi:hypothetical protein
MKETKKCNKCKIEKLICEFGNRAKASDGKRSSCKTCDAEDTRKWRKNNKEKVREHKKNYEKKYPEKKIEKDKLYRKKNRKKDLARKKKWREENPDYHKTYYQKNKSKINKQITEKKKSDFLFKLSSLYRSKINKIIGSKRNSKTFQIIGCSPENLKNHLERQFVEGMTWENHGLFGWHIDHIIPLSSAKTEEELYKLCHFSNLQPLWAKDNLRKSNKADYL